MWLEDSAEACLSGQGFELFPKAQKCLESELVWDSGSTKCTRSLAHSLLPPPYPNQLLPALGEHTPLLCPGKAEWTWVPGDRQACLSWSRPEGFPWIRSCSPASCTEAKGLSGVCLRVTGPSKKGSGAQYGSFHQLPPPPQDPLPQQAALLSGPACSTVLPTWEPQASSHPSPPRQPSETIRDLLPPSSSSEKSLPLYGSHWSCPSD